MRQTPLLILLIAGLCPWTAWADIPPPPPVPPPPECTQAGYICHFDRQTQTWQVRHETPTGPKVVIPVPHGKDTPHEPMTPWSSLAVMFMLLALLAWRKSLRVLPEQDAV